jgi:hypothetical protein
LCVHGLQRDLPFLELVGDAPDDLVGPGPFLLQRRLVEDFLSPVVQAQQGIAIGPVNGPLIKGKNLMAHVLAALIVNLGDSRPPGGERVRRRLGTG